MSEIGETQEIPQGILEQLHENPSVEPKLTRAQKMIKGFGSYEAHSEAYKKELEKLANTAQDDPQLNLDQRIRQAQNRFRPSFIPPHKRQPV